MEALIVSHESKAAAQQRAGRAGRTRPGKAYRLFTEEAFKALPDNNVPEMQRYSDGIREPLIDTMLMAFHGRFRSNLATVILQLKALGIENVLRFDFLSPPPVEIMTRALEVIGWPCIW